MGTNWKRCKGLSTRATRIEIEWLRIWTKYATIWNDHRLLLERIRYKRTKLNRNSTGCRKNSSDLKTKFARLERTRKKYCTISMSYRHNLRKFNILLIDYKLKKKISIWIWNVTEKSVINSSGLSYKP